MLNPSSPASSARATPAASTRALLSRSRVAIFCLLIALDKCTPYTYSSCDRVYAVHLTERHFMNPDAPYPVQYSVDYPDRPLNRLTTFFRLLAVIPIAIVLGL